MHMLSICRYIEIEIEIEIERDIELEIDIDIELEIELNIDIKPTQSISPPCRFIPLWISLTFKSRKIF